MKTWLSVILASLALLASSHAHAQAQSGTGTVAEFIDVDNYIYLRLEESGAWLAAPPLEVMIGDQIHYLNGAEMRDFHSPTLDRTFDSILFVQNVEVVSRDMKQIHSSDFQHGMATEVPEIEISKSAPAPGPGEVQPLEGGKTIAAILADIDGLDGKQVSLRARVIKVTDNVMGKNWVTVQDGTGKEPGNRILVTSSGTAQPGDDVVVEGTLRTNVNLGAGYHYDVLIEDAKISN